MGYRHYKKFAQRKQKRFSLAEKADVQLNRVLKASGFDTRPNDKLEGFKSYWRAVNYVSRQKNRNLYR